MATQRQALKPCGIAGEGAWKQFLEDRELLETHGVTVEEIEFLGTVRLFGRVGTVDEILFILKNLREASRPSTPRAKTTRTGRPSDKPATARIPARKD